MRSLVVLFMLLSLLTLPGCVGGGGNSSKSSDSGGPPTTVANPDALGIATFANGAKFDTSPDAQYVTTQKCFQTKNSQWVFEFNPFTLNGYGARVGQSITFGILDGFVMGGTIRTRILRMDFGGGIIERRWVAMATNGSIYLLKLEGAGAADFEITSFTQSPNPFFGVSQGNGSVWTGGFNGNDRMEIVGVNVTSPGGEPGCYQIRQTVGSTVTDWWYSEGLGFYDTRRATDGYERAVSSGLSRTPFGDG